MNIVVVFPILCCIYKHTSLTISSPPSSSSFCYDYFWCFSFDG